MIEIPGDYLEGGGSIIRVASALSAYTGKACKITNIRAKRCNPGLRAQHLEGLQGLAELCNGKLIGGKIGSTKIEFHPSNELKEKIEINIPTAGSVGLALQSILIASTKSKHSINVHIRGGATNGKWQAPVNFIKHILLPLLEKLNYKADIEIKKYGYYPKGGAEIILKKYPSELTPTILLNRGKIISINGVSHASINLKKAEVAERQKQAAEKIIKEKLVIEAKIEVKYVDTINPGSAIDLYAITENSILGSDGLGELGKEAEKVGEEAALMLIEQLESKAAVDEYIEDQLLPFMAIATEKTGRESRISVPKLTNHTKTNIWVIEKFLQVKFDIEKNIIICKSI